MSKVVYVVISNLYKKVKVETVFSCYEYASKFCDLENSKIEDFRKEDEGFTIQQVKVDSRKVPDNQCYKKYWDYIVNINKDVQNYGTITYADGNSKESCKELVHVNKLQDVEIYEGEFIYCRSYVSKAEAEAIAKEQWQIFEQKQALKRGKLNG